MKKILFYPTSRQVFIWGLIDVFCLVSLGIILPLGIQNNILEMIGLIMALVFAVTFFISINGIIFNKLGEYDGILTVMVLQGCFLGLFLLGIFRSLF